MYIVCFIDFLVNLIKNFFIDIHNSNASYWFSYVDIKLHRYTRLTQHHLPARESDVGLKNVSLYIHINSMYQSLQNDYKFF